MGRGEAGTERVPVRAIPVDAPVVWRLCFVRDRTWAYFTSIPLAEQWGDDWDDAPYEHNAGDPYDGQRPGHRILRVAFEAELWDPATGSDNSQWSVDMINRGLVPWLQSPAWVDPAQRHAIMASATIAEFVDTIYAAGGRVYLEAAAWIELADVLPPRG